MTPLAIIMMILFMLAIWGGLFASIIWLNRAGETPEGARLRQRRPTRT